MSEESIRQFEGDLLTLGSLVGLMSKERVLELLLEPKMEMIALECQEPWMMHSQKAAKPSTGLLVVVAELVVDEELERVEVEEGLEKSEDDTHAGVKGECVILNGAAEAHDWAEHSVAEDAAVGTEVECMGSDDSDSDSVG